MQKAVIYARYSSHSQREESIERQIEICTDYAQRHGMLLVATYTDRKKSGKSGNRPEFQRMIYESRHKLFDVVLVWRFDRFARNLDDHGAYEKLLKENGVKLLSATEEIPDGAHSAIIKGVIIGGNEAYSAELGSKSSDGMKRAAMQGKSVGGHKILGYRTVDGYLTIDEGEAEIVRHIYKMYSQHRSMAEIVRELNKRGIKNSQGNPFQISNMHRLLSDMRYIGIRLYKGKDIGLRIPAIVDKDLFDAVQIQMEKNKKAPARTKGIDEQYLLTGKLFCGACHSPMSGVSGTSKNGTKYHYYVCNTRYKRNSCSKAYITREALESSVIDTVKGTLIKANIPALAKAVVKCCRDSNDNGQLLRLESDLRTVNKAISNLLDIIESGASSETLAERLEQREKQKQILQQEIGKEKILNRIPTEDEVKLFFESFVRGDINDRMFRRELIDILVNSVYLEDKDDGIQKMTVLLNVQNGLETVRLNDVKGCSSNRRMVGQAGFEPATKRL